MEPDTPAAVSPLLFLSHAGEDASVVRELAHRIRESGYQVWLDVEELKPGDRWMKTLEEALARASAFAVYVGRSGIRRWVDREVRAALDRATTDPSFRVLPILGPGAEPQSLPPFLAQHQWLDLRSGTADPETLRSLMHGLLDDPSRAVTLLPPDQPPYRGLLTFDAEHAHLLFGRDREIDDLLAGLRVSPLLAVLARSGSGKSSLVRAGLVPALHRGRFHDQGSWVTSWRIAILRPGNDPFRELANALPDLDPDLAPADRIAVRAACSRQLQEGVTGLYDSIAGLVPAGPRTLLIVDQFEELFTLTEHEDVRRRFIDCLLTALASTGDRPIQTLIALRADFYSRCWEHPELLQQIAANQYPLRPIARDQLREVIEKPLALAGAKLEPGLAMAILDDVGDGPGNLPLLQHALLQLWERRTGDTLDHRTYNRIGRLRGALSHHADEIYQQLEPDEQQLARGIFLRLIQPGEGVADTRRRASRKEILSLGTDRAAVERILLRVVDERLVIAGREVLSEDVSEEVIEVAHEALVRGWERLRDWIDEDREFLVWQKHLRIAVEEWEHCGRDEGALLRGAPLAAAESWVAGREDALSQPERELIHASAQLRRRRRWRSAILAAAGILALVTVSSSFFLLGHQKQRQAQEIRTRSILIAAERHRDPAVGALLVAELDGLTEVDGGAYSARRIAQQAVPQAVLRGHQEGLSSAAFSPDGSRVVTGSDDGSARIWSSDGRGPPIVLFDLLAPWAVRRVSFSPDGQHVLTSAEDGKVRLWRSDGTGPVLLHRNEGRILSEAFSPDGSRVVTASADKTALIWRLDDPAEPIVLRGHGRAVTRAAFSPDGTRIVTASADTTVRIWRDDGSGEAKVLRGHRGPVWSANFSPDGSQIVSASPDGTVRVWPATGEAEPLVFEVGSGRVRSAFFSSDGSRVVAASTEGLSVWRLPTEELLARIRPQTVRQFAVSAVDTRIVVVADDHTAQIWNIDATADPIVLRGHDREVWNAAFSPDGSRVVTASLDGTARIWRIDDTGEPRVFRGHSGAVLNAVFDADGQRLATVSDDGTARIWRWGAAPETILLEGHRGPVLLACFSADGTLLATASEDATARIWRLDEAGQARVLGAHSRAITSIAFSPDGSRVVTASEDRTARIWALHQLEEPIVLRGHEGTLLSASFSPDGAFVVTTSDDETVRIWRLSDLDRPVVLSGHQGPVAGADLSADGARIVTASSDGTARVWRTDGRGQEVVLHGHRLGLTGATFGPDGRLVATASLDGTAFVRRADGLGDRVALSGHQGPLTSIAFSPDGSRVVTASEDGTARVWPADGRGQPMILRGHQGAVTSAVFSPDGSLVATSSDDGTVRLWRVGWEALVEYLRETTTACLGVEQRITLLGETTAEAGSRYEACERSFQRRPAASQPLGSPP